MYENMMFMWPRTFIGGTIIWLIGLVCAIWVIVDVWTNKKKKDNVEKLLWTIAALFFSIITAIIYYFVEKKK